MQDSMKERLSKDGSGEYSQSEKDTLIADINELRQQKQDLVADSELQSARGRQLVYDSDDFQLILVPKKMKKSIVDLCSDLSQQHIAPVEKLKMIAYYIRTGGVLTGAGQNEQGSEFYRQQQQLNLDRFGTEYYADAQAMPEVRQTFDTKSLLSFGSVSQRLGLGQGGSSPVQNSVSKIFFPSTFAQRKQESRISRYQWSTQQQQQQQQLNSPPTQNQQPQ